MHSIYIYIFRLFVYVFIYTYIFAKEPGADEEIRKHAKEPKKGSAHGDLLFCSIPTAHQEKAMEFYPKAQHFRAIE